MIAQRCPTTTRPALTLTVPVPPSRMNKQCRRCGTWKPGEDFRKASNRPDGLYSYCKACHNAESRLYKQRNKEKIRQKSAEYNERNRERVQAQKADYRQRNADKIRAYHQKRYQEQKETINARNLAWYQQNKGRARRNGLSWRRRNPAKAAAIMHRRRSREYGNGGSYTATEWATLCQHYGNYCLCCGGEGRLTPDHVLPLAMGGSNDISNIQPLCLTCNIAKGARHVDYRYS